MNSPDLCQPLALPNRRFVLSMNIVSGMRRYFPKSAALKPSSFLHLGMISDIKRKSLPAIAKAVGLDNPQSLHHFLTESPWTVPQLRQKRLELTLKVVQGRSMIC